VLDKAEYSAFESTLNSLIVSYRIVSYIYIPSKDIQYYVVIFTTIRDANDPFSSSIRDDGICKTLLIVVSEFKIISVIYAVIII